jgi:hypothetical protein
MRNLGLEPAAPKVAETMSAMLSKFAAEANDEFSTILMI